MDRPRVLLADDHTLLLGAFEKLLSANARSLARSASRGALVAAAETLKPDLIVLDISMPLLNGLEAGRQIKQKLRSVKLVFLTMNEDVDPGRRGVPGRSVSLSAEKRSVASELLTAIREVMLGRTSITPLVAEGLVESLQHIDDRNPGGELTPRQREVLQLLAER
jgi:DNA-binding NarL/FixJ family response regulator